MTTLTAGEMFSGYGGLAMAVHDAFAEHGIEVQTKWLAEFDAAPSRILAHRYPGVPNLGDVTAVDWSDPAHAVDIIAGGYPCQPFSQAGRRRGTADERHMWPHVVSAVAAIQPQWCAFENVRGHLSLGFDTVLNDLEYLGYEARWQLRSASSIGAPHRRDRIFILAHRKA